MTNKTQCPNCLTVYIITDEQYQKSKGKVRCGTCRQPFVATFLAPQPESSKDRIKTAGDESTPSNRGEPAKSTEFDAVAEPNQAPPDNRTTLPEAEVSQPDNLEVQKALPSAEIADSEESAFREETPNFFEEPLSAASIDAFKEFGDSQSELTSSRYSSGFEDNLHSDLTIEIEESAGQAGRAQNLINEVDALVAEKLLDEQHRGAQELDDGELSDTSETLILDEPFVLNPKKPRTFLRRWLWTPLLLIVAVLLSLALIFQLWLRQATPWFEQQQLVEKAAPLLDPAKELLDEHFAVQIPERRDLANLRLLSARVEPHPLRPSTTLLKVTLVNKSTIAQPYPWLELVLTDENGRLVSRRALSPLDYLHNNRLRNLLAPNELRPVTIELLAFPRQAHGYELKIINR